MESYTFLFDIGNVLLAFDYSEKLRQLVPEGAGDVTAKLHSLDAKKDVLETGEISNEAFITWALHTLESKTSAEEFINAWRSIFTPIVQNFSLAKKLKEQGHRLILFSNINAIHDPWIYEAYPDFAVFDGAVMSHRIGAMKPHDAFYENAIAMYDLVPERTIYVDDLTANIEAGKKFGFQTFLYAKDHHQELLDWLEKSFGIFYSRE